MIEILKIIFIKILTESKFMAMRVCVVVSFLFLFLSFIPQGGIKWHWDALMRLDRKF